MSNKKNIKACSKPIEVIDLFCGAGGLSRGLSDAGLKIIAGVDLDRDCEFAFSHNNNSQFICCDVSRVDCSALSKLYTANHIRVLSGCAPCQPFSRYGRAAENRRSKWSLLMDFAKIVENILPELITVENVPEVAQHQVFSRFRKRLEKVGYHVKYDFLFCPKFGIPQRRTRLVLIGSRLGEPDLPVETNTRNLPTVRSALSTLRKLEAGESDSKDALHRACKLSKLNLRRIEASKPGGTWRDWPEELRADCHKNESGATFPAVYGRISWDEPSPTITTQFFGYGNGRFGHPEQNRALSLREGAILQTFPLDYKFYAPSQRMSIQKIGQLIGNAVPVRLGFVIGKAIKKHLRSTGLADGEEN
jgi:DNA (cytosine-5)-methyltransferase 1